MEIYPYYIRYHSAVKSANQGKSQQFLRGLDPWRFLEGL